MRYHWGLGIGHLYSRTGDGAGVSCIDLLPIPRHGADSENVENDITVVPKSHLQGLEVGNVSNVDSLGSISPNPPVPPEEKLCDLPDDDSKSCDGLDGDQCADMDEGQGWSDSNGSESDVPDIDDSEEVDSAWGMIYSDDDISYD